MRKGFTLIKLLAVIVILAILGNATGEIWGWKNDYKFFVYSEYGYSWFYQGGGQNAGNRAGIFVFYRQSGAAYGGSSFRVVMLGG